MKATFKRKTTAPNGAAEWRSRMAKTCLMVFLCNLFTFKAMYAQEQHSFSCGTPHNTADNLVSDRDMLAKFAFLN